LRRGAWALLVLVALAAALFAAGLLLAERKQQRHVELVALQPVALPTDAASIERGRYLYTSRGCVACHGADGGGRRFVEDGGLLLAGPQIAAGAADAAAAYTPLDWVRTIRHGVKPDGRPLQVMPSQDYNRLTDADLGAIVAYVKQLPPVAGSPAVLKLPPPLRVAYAFGVIRDAAEQIDHALPPPAPVREALSIEHGRYVAAMCIGCHGPTLSGGKIPGAPPSWPAAANLTPGAGSVLPRYADPASMKAMFRSGQRADRSPVAVMPFESLGAMSDIDIGALLLYLQSLPPRAAGGR
jgi:mono/diheme cytochrome c family protein